MVTIRKRKLGKKDYYYLEHTIKVDGKVKKKEKYLGKDIPKDIELIKQQFFHEVFKEKWFKILEKIKKNFSKEYRSMPKSAKEKYIENFMIKFTYDTNRIEGGTLTLKETADLLEEGVTPKGKPVQDIKEIEAHKKAFYEMLRYEKDLNLNEILYWHRMLFRNSKPEIAGKIRRHQVAVARSKVEFPFYAELNALLRDFFGWYDKVKKKLHPIELAALVHLKFVSIHPFSDGNGRICRLIMNFVLHRYGYPMLDIQYANRDKYYNALERSQLTGKEYIFVQYIVKRYLKAYRIYL